jgi:FkbM family methyltransferase
MSITDLAMRLLPQSLRSQLESHLADRVLGLGSAFVSRRGLTLHPELDWVFSDYLERKGEIFFLQVGANDGKMLDPLFPLLDKRRLRGVLIEPQPGVFEALRANYSAFEPGRFTLVNAAIADADGTQTLYRVRAAPDVPAWALGIATFRKDVLLAHSAYFEACKAADPSGRGVPRLDELVEEVRVDCLSFQTLFDRYRLPHVDCLQVDVEGYDAEILRMFDIARRRPAIVQFEHKHLEAGAYTRCLEDLSRLGYRMAVTPTDTLAYNAAF